MNLNIFIAIAISLGITTLGSWVIFRKDWIVFFRNRHKKGGVFAVANSVFHLLVVWPMTLASSLFFLVIRGIGGVSDAEYSAMEEKRLATKVAEKVVEKMKWN